MMTPPICNCGGKDFYHIGGIMSEEWFTVYCDQCMALYGVCRSLYLIGVMEPSPRRLTTVEVEEILTRNEEEKGKPFNCKSIKRNGNVLDEMLVNVS